MSSRPSTTTTTTKAGGNAAASTSAAPASGPVADASSRKRKRVSRACDQCFSKKDKCDGLHPVCSICVRLGRTCSYIRPERKRGPMQGIRQKLEAQIDALELLLGFCVERLPHDSASAFAESYRRIVPAAAAGAGGGGSGVEDEAWEAHRQRLKAEWRRSALRAAAEGVGLQVVDALAADADDADGGNDEAARRPAPPSRATAESSTSRTSTAKRGDAAATNGHRRGATVAAPPQRTDAPDRSDSWSSSRGSSLSASSPTPSSPSAHSGAATHTPPQPARATTSSAQPAPQHRITIPTAIPSFVARGPPPLSSASGALPASLRHRPGSTYRNRGLVPPGTDPNEALGGFDLGFQDDEEAWYSGVLRSGGEPTASTGGGVGREAG